MRHSHTHIVALVVALTIALGGCSRNVGTTENHDMSRASASRSEHDREGGAAGGEGEESGDEFTLNDTYDEVRNGARLILTYDAASNSFRGTVQNITEKELSRVRVEVHLSNGRELGPTVPVKLAPGERRNVLLKATSTGFKKWGAHPEVGNDEHGRGGEGSGEHSERSREGRGEHSEGRREGRGEHGGERRERGGEHR